MSENKIPVIICLSNTISGAVSWAFRLKYEFRNHPNYKIILLGRDVESEDHEYDLVLSIKGSNRYSAYDLLKKFSNAIIVPNWLWNLYPICAKLKSKGKNISCIGFCRSDNEYEYYNNLVKNEAFISHFVAVSPECGSALLKRIPHRVNDISILPSGVFVPHILTRSYNTQPIRIVYGGRLEQRQKRVMDFVPLVKIMLANKINFIFSIAGDGSYLLPLMEAMRKCKHAGRVRFFGRLSSIEMIDVWREHDIFIQMSDFEGTSNSMLESMSQGTVPLVTTASSGINGIIEHQINGFTFPIGDVESMAETINFLANQPQLLQKVGEEAYQKAKLFSMDSYAQKFTSILDKLVQNY